MVILILFLYYTRKVLILNMTNWKQQIVKIFEYFILVIIVPNQSKSFKNSVQLIKVYW